MSQTASIVASVTSRISALAGRNKGKDENEGHRGLTDEQDAELREVFSVFDKDRDGFVSESELKEVMATLGQHLSEDDMTELMQKYDDNNNGQLEFDEFKAMIRDRMQYENTEEEFLEAFRAVDKNGDNCIDLNEMAKLLAVVGGKMDTAEMVSVFKEFDEDGTGKIDYAEFVKHMMRS